MMKILILIVASIASSLALPRMAAACSCAAPGDPCTAIKAADVVFVGRAVDVQPASTDPANPRAATARFAVAEVLHGTVPGAVVLSNGNGASCLFAFAAGRDYLVYARSAGGVLEAGLCSRTAELAGRKHELDVLRERRRGAPVPRLAGRIVEGRQRLDGHLGSEALPLAGTAVTAQQGTAVRRTVTDAEGSFVFLNLPAGVYKVSASLPAGYERVSGQDTSVNVACYAQVDIGVSRVPLHGTLAIADGSLESTPVTIHAFAIDRSVRVPSPDRSTFTYRRATEPGRSTACHRVSIWLASAFISRAAGTRCGFRSGIRRRRDPKMRRSSGWTGGPSSWPCAIRPHRARFSLRRAVAGPATFSPSKAASGCTIWMRVTSWPTARPTRAGAFRCVAGKAGDTPLRPTPARDGCRRCRKQCQ